MRVCCPSSRALPAAELAHGQAARKRWGAAWSGDPGAWVLRFLVGTHRSASIPGGEVGTGASPPSQQPPAPSRSTLTPAWA